MKYIFSLFLLIYTIGTAIAQVSVVNRKGTLITLDSSKWTLSGTNIYNKNTGNVGIGNTNPTYKLDISGKVRLTDSLVANTARIITLPAATVNDSLVMADASTGLLERISPNRIVREPWNIIGGTTPSTSNTDNVYMTGNVSIGKSTNTAQLDVRGRINADSTIAAPNYTSTVQTITGTWNLNLGANAVWSLSAGANTLTISNAKAGMYGLIRLINSGTSTITLPSGSKVINGGAGAVTLTQTASAVDILTFFYDGTNYWWTVGNNYN